MDNKVLQSLVQWFSGRPKALQYAAKRLLELNLLPNDTLKSEELVSELVDLSQKEKSSGFSKGIGVATENLSYRVALR